jgi:hypothetical protein
MASYQQVSSNNPYEKIKSLGHMIVVLLQVTANPFSVSVL